MNDLPCMESEAAGPCRAAGADAGDCGAGHRLSLIHISIVVSEETGIISLAKNGVLIRRLDRQSLYNLLEEDIAPSEPEKNSQSRFFGRRKANEETT